MLLSEGQPAYRKNMETERWKRTSLTAGGRLVVDVGFPWVE